MDTAPRRHQLAVAFTLVELLVVISIIIVLVGLAFPVFQSVQNAAKKTQAKNDLVQIVTAVNAFYTEYGKYPTSVTPDAYFGPGTMPTGMTSGGANNDVLFDVLRNNAPSGGANNAAVASLNPRGIVYLEVPNVKSDASPRSGVASITVGSTRAGVWYDPWGSAYSVAIDSDYNNQVINPYSANAGSTPLRAGVVAWSLGKDAATPPAAPADKNTGINKDDVISWQ